MLLYKNSIIILTLLVSGVLFGVVVQQFVSNSEKTCTFIGEAVYNYTCHTLTCTDCSCHGKISCSEAIAQNISTTCCGDECNSYYSENCHTKFGTCRNILTYYVDSDDRHYYINSSCTINDPNCATQYSGTRSCWNGEFTNPISYTQVGLCGGFGFVLFISGVFCVCKRKDAEETSKPLL